jgi:protein O-GlcNAc transferase
MSSTANLLQRALRQHQGGALDEAEKLYRSVLARNPDHAGALAGLGALYIRLGKLPAAIGCLQRSLGQRPDQADTWLRLADAYRSQGSLPDALAAAGRAVALAPRDGLAHLIQGSVLAALGRLAEAAASLTEAVRLVPDSARAHNDLGCVLLLAGKNEEAARHLERAAALEPGADRTQYYLGVALHRLGRRDAAEAALRRATELDPGGFDAQWQRAQVLMDAERYDDAVAALEQTLAIRPDAPEAHRARAYLLGRLGLAAEAAAAHHEALRTNPDSEVVHGNFLLFSCYDPDLPPADLLARTRAWSDRCLAAAGPVGPHANDPDPERPLQVGYISPDFCGHAVAGFIEPVLRHHDRDRISVTCYANVAHPDRVTAFLRRIVQGWRDISGQSDDDVARSIRADGIDILVDLAGYTGRGRVPVLARAPAPIQVSYLGYPATTGLPTVTYRLTDSLADPPGVEAWYTEGLWRLEPPFFCYQPFLDAPDVGPLPADTTGAVTFGCLLNPLKVNRRTVALWARVLEAVPGARLLVFRDVLSSPRARARILADFAETGIGADRIDLEWRRPEDGGHHAVFRRIDIALDTVPFCGHTTTCEALWMGVPTVTRAGDLFAGRMGACVLTAVGLDDLIAPDDDAFVAIAARLAGDRQRLSEMRAALRERVRHSPICDAAGFTRRLEAAYREMWRRWCADPGRR